MRLMDMTDIDMWYLMLDTVGNFYTDEPVMKGGDEEYGDDEEMDDDDVS